jgi:hypothetical protein
MPRNTTQDLARRNYFKSYYLSAILGMRAERRHKSRTEHVPIINIDPADLSSTTEAYDIFFLARTTGLLVFNGTALLSIVLFVRRTRTPGPEVSVSELFNRTGYWEKIGLFRDPDLDHLNFSIAFGGPCAGFTSLLICLLSRSWICRSDAHTDTFSHDFPHTISQVHLRHFWRAFGLQPLIQYRWVLVSLFPVWWIVVFETVTVKLSIMFMFVGVLFSLVVPFYVGFKFAFLALAPIRFSCVSFLRRNTAFLLEELLFTSGVHFRSH